MSGPRLRQNGATDTKAGEPRATEIGAVIAKWAIRPTPRRIGARSQAARMYQGDELIGFTCVHFSLLSASHVKCNRNHRRSNQENRDMIGMPHFPDMTLSLPLTGVPLVYFRSWCRTDRKRALSYGREYSRPVPEPADISTMSGFVA